MKKIKSFIKNIKQSIKEFLNKIFVKPLKKLLSLLGDLWYKYLTPILSKIGKVLTNNFILKITHTHFRFLGIKFKNSKKNRERFYGYLFISLWLIGFVVFTLIPLVNSFYLSFTTSFFNIETGITSKPAQFTNYFNILQDQTLLPLYVSYFGKIMLAVPLVVIFSMIISMLINQPIRGKGIWRMIFFLPVIISTGPVINELTRQDAVSLPSLSENQLIIYITNNLGSFIADPVVALLESLLLVLWYAGIPILIFLASLQKIDKSIYEASSIDGASPWDNFWKITLPSIKPFITINVIYIVVQMSLFVEPGGLLDLTRTHMNSGAPDSLLWKGYGYASAMAWIYFLLMIIIMGIYIGLLSIKPRRRR